MISRNSNWRSFQARITGCPHLVQGSVSKAGKSLGIQLLVLQDPQIVLRNIWRTWLEVSDTLQRYQYFRKGQVLKCKKCFDNYPRLVFFTRRTMMTIATKTCLSAPGAMVRHAMRRSDCWTLGNVEGFF